MVSNVGRVSARGAERKGARSSSSSLSVVVVVLVVEERSRCFVKGNGKRGGPSDPGTPASESEFS